VDDEKRLKRKVDVGELLDIYGKLLPSQTRELLMRYYEDDLSLSELAAEVGRTRQSVHENLRRGEARLRAFEAALGLREQKDRLRVLHVLFIRFLEQVLASLREEGQELLREISRLAEGDEFSREVRRKPLTSVPEESKGGVGADRGPLGDEGKG